MEYSSFFNDIENDRLYDMEDFAEYFKDFLSTGVYHQDNVPALRVVTTSGLSTKLEPGKAFIEGYRYKNTEDITFTHEKADTTNPRIDRIVLRLDRTMSGRNVKSFIKKGTPATNPTPPTLQRDNFIYEISLAQVRINAGTTSITSITDERFDKNVAGLVSSLISVPLEEFQRQWDAWFTGRQNDVGVRLTTGSTEPTNVVAGDVWFKTI